MSIICEAIKWCLMKHVKMEFMRFLLVGTINTVTGYAVYLSLVFFIPYLFAYTISYVVGICVSYYLNTRFVFKTHFSLKKFLKFPLVYLFQYIFGICVVYLVVQKLGWHKALAPILAVILSVPFTFLLSRLIIKPKSPKILSPPL